MEGYGEFHDLKSEILYIGFFEENLYNGFGVLRNYKDNYIFAGEWRKNQREGIGRYFKNRVEGFGKYKNNSKIMEYNSSEEMVSSIQNGNEGLLPFITIKKYEELVKFTKKKRIMEE